jgi:beta-glucosidase
MGGGKPEKLDMAADAEIAQRQEEAGIVLLQNTGAILPLSNTPMRIAVIGGHAEAGGLTGGGSSQVVGPGGPAASVPITGEGVADTTWNTEIFDGTSPLSAIRQAAPQASVTFTTARYPAQAAEAARHADIAIVFATQWNIEGEDLPDLSLPDGQDAVISAVAAANKRIVVVLETGNPVLMPWRRDVAGIVEAWYPGARGGAAIANVLFGAVNPSGRLPLTFPASLSQLPRPVNPGLGQAEGADFPVVYSEGSDVGYRWYAASPAAPLFPFGFGLSYTRFSIGGLSILPGKTPSFSFRVTNTGARSGTDTPQIYLLGGPNRKQMRLLGWARVTLLPGETRLLNVSADPRLLASWDQARHGWSIEQGAYNFAVAESAAALLSHAQADLPAQILAP